jgi:hypothetical protein
MDPTIQWDQEFVAAPVAPEQTEEMATPEDDADEHVTAKSAPLRAAE